MAPLDKIESFQSGSRFEKWKGPMPRSLFRSRIAGILMGGVISCVPQTTQLEDSMKNLQVVDQEEEKGVALYYTRMIQDAFGPEKIRLPKNFLEISVDYIQPLHQVLKNLGMGGVFTGDDAANITVLAMKMNNRDEKFFELYDFVAGSFPNPEIDKEFREVLAELFNVSLDK